MSSLVLLGEQTCAVELATLLERLPGAAAGLSALAQGQKHAQLLEQGVFAPAAQAALMQASDEDVVAALTLSFAVLAALPSAAEASAAAAKLASLLTSEPQVRAGLKIRTLTHLINVVGQMSTVTAAQRFALLLQLLEFALAATPAAAAAASSSANHAAASSSAVSPAALVLQPVSSLKAQIREWKLSSSDATALLLVNYRLAQRVAAAGVQQRKSKTDDFSGPVSVPITYNLGQQPSVQHDYLFALLQSLDAAQPAVLREKQNHDLALQAALQSAANGIASTLHQLDPVNVFQLAAVQALSPAAGNKDAASLAAFELLRILVDADFPGWLTFQKGAGAALLKEQAATLDGEVLLRRVRVLALAALAVEQQGANGQGDNVLSYETLATRLQLPAKDNDAVEAAVIDAVMAGRIDAKMDGDAQTLVVKRVTGGVPLSLYTGPNSQAAWAALGQRLAVWRENIHSVLTTLSAQHQQAQGDEVEDLQ